MSRHAEAPEFSFVVRPADIGSEPAAYSLVASPAERAALAARFDLIDIEALAVDIAVEWLRGHAFLRVSGRIRAAVVQRCVVTLQPVRGEIDAPFEILYEADGRGGRDVVVEFEDVEPLPPGELDIGEVAAEEFALMLDPYPRAPGAALEQDRFGPRDEATGAESGVEDRTPADGSRPFEVLAALKRNK